MAATGAAGWIPYADALCKDTANIKAGAIVGTDGSLWAKKAMDISTAEAKGLAAGLSDTSKFQGGGIVVGGVKYMFLNADTAKKTAVGRKGPTTIMLAGTTKAIIVILTVDGANPGNVTSHTFIQDDLIKKKF
jgi:predicted regulator of Ras-like GTPase activity (Roadblock/LC7/MglB family)